MRPLGVSVCGKFSAKFWGRKVKREDVGGRFRLVKFGGINAAVKGCQYAENFPPNFEDARGRE